MSEIEKMYENAGIEPISEYCKHQCNLLFNDNACIGCKHIEKIDYPLFTPEKQLELIKWLMANAKDYQYDVENGKYWFIIDDYRETKYREFDEALAELITLYWQDLTPEEKQQIKEILDE